MTAAELLGLITAALLLQLMLGVGASVATTFHAGDFVRTGSRQERDEVGGSLGRMARVSCCAAPV